METENRIRIASDIATVFRLAAEVERWPSLLPHYRYVNVLAGDSRLRVVEMAAHRDGYPVRWLAVQRIDLPSGRIIFNHIGGPSRGMHVEWEITELGGETEATIRHELRLPWTRGGPIFARYIIGELFVRNIASKTLRRIKQIAESEAASRTESK